MEEEYNKVPELKDPSKWIELEVKKEVIYVESGTLLRPIGEKRYFRQIKDGKIDSGIAMSISFFKKDDIMVSWSYPSPNKNYELGYMALKMKSGKWAVTNPLINGVTIEEEKTIFHIHKYRDEVWLMLKVRKGWLIRKIKKDSRV